MGNCKDSYANEGISIVAKESVPIDVNGKKEKRQFMLISCFWCCRDETLCAYSGTPLLLISRSVKLSLMSFSKSLNPSSLSFELTNVSFCRIKGPILRHFFQCSFQQLAPYFDVIMLASVFICLKRNTSIESVGLLKISNNKFAIKR